MPAVDSAQVLYWMEATFSHVPLVGAPAVRTGLPQHDSAPASSIPHACSRPTATSLNVVPCGTPAIAPKLSLAP